MALDTTGILLAVNIGTLAAVVYSIRIVVSLEQKISRLLAEKGIK